MRAYRLWSTMVMCRNGRPKSRKHQSQARCYLARRASNPIPDARGVRNRCRLTRAAAPVLLASLLSGVPDGSHSDDDAAKSGRPANRFDDTSSEPEGCSGNPGFTSSVLVHDVSSFSCFTLLTNTSHVNCSRPFETSSEGRQLPPPQPPPHPPPPPLLHPPPPSPPL